MHGRCDERFTALNALAGNLAVEDDDGVVLAVEVDGEFVVDLWVGRTPEASLIHTFSKVKPLTAWALLLAHNDEQRLRLHDRVIELLPQLDLTGSHSFKGTECTGDLELHHLLHQTSGLADYFDGGFNEDFKRNRDRRYTVTNVVDIARNAESNFPPGDRNRNRNRNRNRSAYSDTNYQLLTAIIETTTNGSYGDAVHQRITGPLGMADTHVVGHQPMPPGQPPLTLYYKGQALDLPRALASERGAGGIVSTLDDQLRFSTAYHQGQLFDPRHTAEMHRWNRIFFPVDYGYGLMRYQLPKAMTGFRSTPELIGHSGSTNSFTFHAPELHCHIAGTLNQLDKPSRAFRLIPKVTAAVGKAT